MVTVDRFTAFYVLVASIVVVNAVLGRWDTVSLCGVILFLLHEVATLTRK